MKKKNNITDLEFKIIVEAMPIISECMGLVMIYLDQPDHKAEFKVVNKAFQIMERKGVNFIVRPKPKKLGRPIKERGELE